ncbi:DUF6318 family protein [Cellulomonas sp. S1-8]|uniref:DUF6318 family protein n=1 Tax=Cellulomonas sp. S1-8 TaxID=2904790 RepID=UPI0022442A79|nr:DUF6318 family protein [Cellulomonas sp. S1-8]UZN03037.1 DUF6318 family protein [Cellulomonas sp. S1-8]
MRIRGRIVVVVVAVGLVTGCTADAEPVATASAEPTVTATESPTPTPTPTPTMDVTVPPERPEAMGTASADGAAAAARYFISLYPYAYATGDLAAWNELAATGCAFCDSTRDGVTRVHQGGGRVEGGTITVESADGTEVDAGRWYSATVVATEAPSAEHDVNGTILSESPGGVYEFAVALTFASGSWIVDAVDVTPVQ